MPPPPPNTLGIRTHDLNRRAAADLRLRPRGYWNRQYVILLLLILNSQSQICNTEETDSHLFKFFYLKIQKLRDIWQKFLRNSNLVLLFPIYHITHVHLTLEEAECF
jgi:hypothetical protein